MSNDLKTWQSPKLTMLDIDQTLSSGLFDFTEGSFSSGIPGRFGRLVDGVVNSLGTPGGS